MGEDYRVPFLPGDPNLEVAGMPPEAIARLYDAHPLGVHGRTNTSLLYPVKIANLIGVRDVKYFDRTATSRNRNIQDLMRYSEMIADVSDALTHYGDGPDATLKLENMGLGAGVKRTPDAVVYALARFLYSLQPPANPNPKTELSQHGSAVFESAGCSRCHTAPLFRSAVAEGMRLFAHGIFGNRSIRIPAAWCGLGGHDPTDAAAATSRRCTPTTA
jgi:hypothetical protein